MILITQPESMRMEQQGKHEHTEYRYAPSHMTDLQGKESYTNAAGLGCESQSSHNIRHLGAGLACQHCLV